MADSVVVATLHAAGWSDPAIFARAVEGALVREIDAGSVTGAISDEVTEIDCKMRDDAYMNVDSELKCIGQPTILAVVATDALLAHTRATVL